MLAVLLRSEHQVCGSCWDVKAAMEARQHVGFPSWPDAEWMLGPCGAGTPRRFRLTWTGEGSASLANQPALPKQTTSAMTTPPESAVHHTLVTLFSGSVSFISALFLRFMLANILSNKY